MHACGGLAGRVGGKRSEDGYGMIKGGKGEKDSTP